MEKSAKLILNERKYESNIKRHDQQMAEEESYRRSIYMTMQEKRDEAKLFTEKHDNKLD